MRSPKKIFHIYVECKQTKLSSEVWYFQILQRALKNVVFNYYHSDVKFRKLAKTTKDSNQYFVAVLDVDIDYNCVEKSKKDRVDIIQKFANSPNVEVYISSRCWENWLVSHFQIFNTFTVKDTPIPIPDYRKKREWYTSNQKNILDSMVVAVERCKKQRFNAYENNEILIANNILPDLKDRKLCLQIVENCNPISYMDILIEKIYLIDGNPLEIPLRDKVTYAK